MQDPTIYEKLNRAWKEATVVIFKKELSGELEDYKNWLMEYAPKPAKRKLYISNESVYVMPPHYCKDARYIGLNEMDFKKKFEPLNINEIKDIDGIVNAVKERFAYSGNILTGNNNHIVESTNVNDSMYVYNSSNVGYSKYVAYSYLVKNSEYIFGTLGDGESAFTIKNITGNKNKRLLDSYSSDVSTDMYYTARVDNSSEVMFSFGLKGVHHVIGNLKLPIDKYSSIKNELLSQMVLELEKNKRIFSLLELMDIMSEPNTEYKLTPSADEEGDKKPIREAFSRTTKILFERPLKDIELYKKFLLRHIYQIHKIKSAVSSKPTYLVGYISDVMNTHHNLAKRTVRLDEIKEIGKKYRIREKDLEHIRFDKEILSEMLRNIAFLSVDAIIGENINVFDAVVFGHARDCYAGSAYYNAKECAFDFWPRESNHIFGSNIVWNSQFGINIYDSVNLSRAFEVCNSKNSSDIYFSHNVENVHEGMFNFNIKNLQYGIGNAEYPKDVYLRTKSMLLSQIHEELTSTKTLKWDIYTLGCL